LKKFSCLIIVLLIFFYSISITAAAEVYWKPNLRLEGRYDEDFIGRAGVIYPITQKKDSIFYGDLRGLMGSDDIYEWNLGLGYRKIIENKNKDL